MKKLVSLLLVCLMSITMLTGCGVNDLGYLNLSKETADITEFKFDNQTQVKVSKEIAEKNYNIDLNLKGEANVKDLNKMYASFDLQLKFNGIGIENPVNFKIADNNLYVSKSALLEIAEIQKEIEDNSAYKKVMDELHKNELKNVDYILLTDLGTTYEDTSYKELSDKAFNYIKTAFKGFDSKLVTKTAKGYSMELTSEGALAFAENLFKYLSENKELVFDETVKYIADIYSMMEIEDVSEEEIQEIIQVMKDSRQEFYDFVDEAAVMLKSEEVSTYINMVKGSKFKEELYKEGQSYKQKIEASVVYEGTDMGSIVSTTSITPAKIQAEAIKGEVIKAEDLEVMYNNTENKVNPVKKMELEWYEDGIDVQVTNTRQEGNTGFDFKEYTIIDGRIYLPLRYVCETFGEQVEWDNNARKAYIVRGTEKIDMTGTIIDSQTMVKIRDFEKLGYKVNYNQVDGVSTATIEK